MDSKDFDGLIAGLNDALSYAKGHASLGTRVHRVKVDRAFVAEARLKERRQRLADAPSEGSTVIDAEAAIT